MGNKLKDKLNDRVPIPPTLRAKLLIANQHACCICGERNVQLHHINGNPADNRGENIAVLCIGHHAEATAPSGMTARLTASDIATRKLLWEKSCHQRAERAARSRTAFFMVDYKNVDRLQQLYAQLSATERAYAADRLQRDLRDESNLRTMQGFDISIEPNLGWSQWVEYLLQELKSGGSQPRIFQPNHSHHKTALSFDNPFLLRALYDQWCQVIARALVVCREAYNIDDLMDLNEPQDLCIDGAIVSCVGRTRGTVHEPRLSEVNPASTVIYRMTGDRAVWSTSLTLKTQYVYSFTAATNLSNGKENGLLVFRSIDGIRRSKSGPVHVRFSATPLILGVGELKIP